MRYEDFRRKGLFMGSGVVEAGCRVLIGQRLNQSGMFWTVNGAFVRYCRLVSLFYAASALPRGAGAPCKSPWVLRSSSRSDQCIPYPAPAIRQFARCSGVACSKRGYQARGTVMVRPSKRSTLRVSSVTRTSLTRSPALGSKVVIPCLQ